MDFRVYTGVDQEDRRHKLLLTRALLRVCKTLIPCTSLENCSHDKTLYLTYRNLSYQASPKEVSKKVKYNKRGDHGQVIVKD